MKNGKNNSAYLALMAMTFLLVLMMSGCATPEPPASAPVRLTGVLTGTAAYRERIALPPGAVLRVSLEDQNAADQATSVVATAVSKSERQAPLPFTVAYDPTRINQTHYYVVRAQIESPNGQRLWSTAEPYGVITLGNPDHVDVQLHPARVDLKALNDEDALNGRGYTYQCEGLFFTVRHAPAMVALYMPSDYMVLPQVRSASGVKYQQGDTQFWNKGNEAMLDVGGQHYAECKFDAARTAQEDAKLRSISVQAGSNGPYWMLEIEKGRWLRFIGEESGSSAYLPAQISTINGTDTIYKAKSAAHELQVVIQRTACEDAASGKRSDAKVTVTADGRTYHGCGQVME